MTINLRNIFHRMQPTQQDIQTLHGVIMAIAEGRKGPARGGVLDSEEAERLRTLLAEHEQGRVPGERGPVRGLSRLLLGHCLGRPANQVPLQYNEFGKPVLAGELHPSLQFNLSHSGDLVFVALSRGRALGIDVERMREDLATKEIAARFFSAEECRVLDALPSAARCEAGPSRPVQALDRRREQANRRSSA